MPSKSKSERSLRSRSRGRSRSRSRGRSKSPSRTKQAKQAKQSPSPARQSRSTKSAPKQLTKSSPKTTPTRQSARIKDIVEKQESLSQEEEETVNTQTSVKTTVTMTTTSTKSSSDDKPTQSKYKFGGPIGAFAFMLVLPALVLGMELACSKKSCSLDKLPSVPRTLSSYFDRKSAMLFFGFLLFQVLLELLPVGKVVKGLPRGHFKAATYRCNGFVSLLVNYAVLGGFIYLGYPVTLAYDKLFQLTSFSLCTGFVVSAVLYFKGRGAADKDRSPDGNTGCLAYDFFVGRELNPRVGSLDVKMLLVHITVNGWSIMNAIFVWKAYTAGDLYCALATVAILQNLYAADSIFFEETLLSSFEVNQESTGFKAVCAYFSIPFLYSLQTRYLLEHPRPWHAAFIAGFVIMNLIGYIIYRGANSEKDRFRRDPHNPAFASSNKIPTSSGRKLLASGWWGLCRHPNYLGDLIMALAWTLPCGFAHFLPYFYPLMLTIFLLDRVCQMESDCRARYGAGWDRYCREVKYRLIPYVY